MSSNVIMIDERPHILAVTKIITEQKIIEQELRMAKEKAEENDRLKSAFLANISHEIRTPMNAILGFSELLRFEDYDEETRLDFIETIHSSGQHLLAIINDIVEISRIETTEMNPTIELVDISKVLENIRKQVSLPESLRQHLSLDFQTTPLLIRTDPTKLQQILLNLVSNAIKFTDSGSITVTYKKNTDGLISISVTDTGIGIPEEYQDLVFERFRQVPGDRNIQQRGSGLGLAITKAYVELLGGWIGLKSSPGKGSTFHFTIRDFSKDTVAPLKPEKIESSKDPQTNDPTNQDHFKILIVEDDDVNYSLLHRLLTQWGFQHERAIHGLEAVEKGVRQDIRMILMDISLPKMNGIEALRRIRTQRKDIPIFAQTAHALREEIDKFEEEEFDEYLIKPINHRELLRKIRAHM